MTQSALGNLALSKSPCASDQGTMTVNGLLLVSMLLLLLLKSLKYYLCAGSIQARYRSICGQYLQ